MMMMMMMTDCGGRRYGSGREYQGQRTKGVIMKRVHGLIETVLPLVNTNH